MCPEKNEKNVPTSSALLVFKEVLSLQGAAFHPKEASERLGIPIPNIYRHISVLVGSGFLIRMRRSHYLPHPTFLKLLAPFKVQSVLRLVIRPILEQAGKDVEAALHFGVLDSDMVTYIAKVDRYDMGLFTEENSQLEAYCSAIGKCLLASLPTDKLDEYLSASEFPKLTDNTIVDPAEIRREICVTKKRGYGIDNREIREDLVCIAVPVSLGDGSVIGSVSAASTRADLTGAPKKNVLSALRQITEKIANVLQTPKESQFLNN